MTRLAAFLRPLASLTVLTLCQNPLRAAPSSWIRGSQSELRLLDGGEPRDDGRLLAALDIRLAPGFVTYWRDPGDAGVPPSVSFTGSTNLKSATLLYPAPRSLDEAGAKAFGYEDEVVFPIVVAPADPGKPVGLAVTIDYAVCHDICLPSHAALRLTLDGTPADEAGQVLAALAAVPRAGAVGRSGGPVTIEAVTSEPDGGFTVAATIAGEPGHVDATLFVEAPEGWAYAVGAARIESGHILFPVKRLDHPAGSDRPSGTVVLTLVSHAGAVEVPVQLDGGASKP